MALYTRYVLIVDAATGDDTRGSGSSAALKDSDALSGTTLVITNAAGGSTVTRADAAAFAGPPLAGVDTLVCTDTVGGLGLFHIGAVSGDNKTLTLIETPATGTSIGNPWGIGGYFATIARAAALVTPTNTNAGADDHVYVKTGAYTGTAKITFSKAGSRSRPLIFEGYTTTPGDGGQATYDITATATIALEPTGNDQVFRNFTCTNSGNVGSWRGVSQPGSARISVDNLWVTTSGTAAVGFDMNTNAVYAWRGRSSCTASGGSGLRQSNSPIVAACFVVHDCGSSGYLNRFHGLNSISDSNGTATASGGFHNSSGVFAMLGLSTSYNQGSAGDGFRIADLAGVISNYVFGSIFANNAGYGINRAGITASFPLHMEAYNDLFGNGTAPGVLNVEDTTGYDTVPTTSTLDPGFVDAPNQNFAIGTNLRAAAAIALQVGGTSYLDMGAVQRQEGPFRPELRGATL